jgi:hypothetical protein
MRARPIEPTPIVCLICVGVICILAPHIYCNEESSAFHTAGIWKPRPPTVQTPQTRPPRAPSPIAPQPVLRRFCGLVRPRTFVMDTLKPTRIFEIYAVENIGETSFLSIQVRSLS